jgi:NADPH-dependent ferric siderophore reductase
VCGGADERGTTSTRIPGCFDAAAFFGWVACENRTTRTVTEVFREQYGIPRKSIKAQAYWVA